MRKKKLIISKKLVIVLVTFLILIGIIVFQSLKNDVHKSENIPDAEEQEVDDNNHINLEENEKDKTSVPEVNAENDRDHSFDETIIPIEGMEEHIEPILHWRQYLLYDKLKTYVERYAPDTTSATCLNLSPCETNSDIICFYLELDNPKHTIVEAAYDTNIKQVTVKECTKYTKEEIINEVWITDNAPVVRDSSQEDTNGLNQ